MHPFEPQAQHVPLAGYTTIGIGGPARWFHRPTTVAELCAAIAWARRKHLPFLILGGGSNLVLPDSGYPGLVLQLALMGRHWQERADEVTLHVMAGEDWDQLVAFSVERGWAGIECLSGIPGLVGAAPIQNIGAYGQELCETLIEVDAVDLETNATVTIPNRECGFTYRDSIFKSRNHGRYLVTGIRLRLHKHTPATIVYPDLQRRLSPDAGLDEVRRTVLLVRRQKSMIADPADPNARGCGSFFTNPILDEDAYLAFAARHPGPHPQFAAGPGRLKIPAAWLIEQAGFTKGYTKGRVGLSQKHCLAIINRGDASAAEVLDLAEEITRAVALRFAIQLQPEPVVISDKF